MKSDLVVSLLVVYSSDLFGMSPAQMADKLNDPGFGGKADSRIAGADLEDLIDGAELAALTEMQRNTVITLCSRDKVNIGGVKFQGMIGMYFPPGSVTHGAVTGYPGVPMSVAEDAGVGAVRHQEVSTAILSLTAEEKILLGVVA